MKYDYFSNNTIYKKPTLFFLDVEFPKPSCIETTEIKDGFICNFTLHPLGLIGFHYSVGQIQMRYLLVVIIFKYFFEIVKGLTVY